jgi:hypothetical protein
VPTHGNLPDTEQLLDYPEPPPLWKGKCFVLTGIDTLDMNLLVLHESFCKDTIPELIHASDNIML